MSPGRLWGRCAALFCNALRRARDREEREIRRRLDTVGEWLGNWGNAVDGKEEATG